MSIKQLAMRLVYGHKASSEQYVSCSEARGCSVGQHVHLYTPWSIRIDTQRPWMIEIGDNVHITADCSILQHDYSWAVIQRLTGEVLGSCGTVHIGNNVFIGQKSLILKGAEIGDNTIVGAGRRGDRPFGGERCICRRYRQRKSLPWKHISINAATFN